MRTCHELTVHDAAIQSIVAFDGEERHDYTRQRNSGAPFYPWGLNPRSASEQMPALYLGFDPFPSNTFDKARPLTLWFRTPTPAPHQQDEYQRIRDEEFSPPAQEPNPPIPLLPADRLALPRLDHPSLTTVWELRVGPDAWEPLRADDRTRGFTLDGPVVLYRDAPTKLGEPIRFEEQPVPTPLTYVRCRVASGRLDEAPVLTFVDVNTVLTEQSVPTVSRISAKDLRVKLLTAREQHPQPNPLPLDEVVRNHPRWVAGTPLGTSPTNPLVEWVAEMKDGEPTAIVPIFVYAEFDRVQSDGRTRLWLEHAPVVVESLRVFIAEPPDGPSGSWALHAWSRRPDWDNSGPGARDYVVDPTQGIVEFGDGAHGRTLPRGALAVVAATSTAGASEGIAERGVWDVLIGDEDAVRPNGPTRALLGATDVFTLMNPERARHGADEETVAEARARLTASLRAPERLVELGAAAGQTLDGLDRADVLAVAAPDQAVAAVDYERLAIDVPGAPMRRARAFAGLDPDFPGMTVPGTVTVVVIPGLPVGKPRPGRASLARVARYLDRRRTVGTRLIVVGPQYVEVVVRATLRARPDAPREIAARAAAALKKFLDPLDGGERKRGWPMGRAVYRSEILACLDRVEGVDHVVALDIFADRHGRLEEVLANLSLCPLELVTSGPHKLEVLPA